MGRARVYENAAERQAAYRARHREKEPPLTGELAGLARTLHGWYGDAVRAGVSPWPAELWDRRSDETMRNLVRYLRGIVAAAEEQPPVSTEGAAKKGGEAPDTM
jgi:hypothetical protein